MIPQALLRAARVLLTLLPLYSFSATAADQRVYVGTYTSDGSRGIYRFDFDQETGRASAPVLAAESTSPSFLAAHPNGEMLFAVNEVDNFADGNSGAVSGFRIESDGALTLINKVATRGGWPCHLALVRDGGVLLVANYAGGNVASLPVAADGTIGPVATLMQYEGSSVNPRRQQAPHAHGVHPDAREKYFYVPDLGTDRIMIHELAEDGASFSSAPRPFVSTKPGAGPRHLALHPNDRFAFGINELDSTITVFRRDVETGGLTTVESVTTLPEDFVGSSTTAEIVVHPNGRFLYGSNRGHDSLAIFRVDADTGRLEAVGHQSTFGKTPRHFAIAPGGQFLLAANQNSDSITFFRIDPEHGTLTRLEQTLAVSRPVCLLFSPIRGQP